MQRKFLSGGVSRRFTRRPKGQSTVEYVLIIAIIVLVALIAGPWVSSAIRNQFNLVAGTIGSGTTGENFYEPEDIPDPQSGTAFAVYSEDDHSLMFYKRKGLPKVGDMFNSRRVTQVYTGFEAAKYTHDSHTVTDGLANTCDTPWYGVKDDILSASVIDTGIKPKSLSYWFANMLNVRAIDIEKLEPSSPVACTWTFINCRKMTSVSLPANLKPSRINDIFYCCSSLQSDGLSMPGFDTSLCTDMWFAFYCCKSLTYIPGIENWDTSSNREFRGMFYNSPNLVADLSTWDVSLSQSGSSIPHSSFDFGAGCPGVTLPKAWQ